MAQQINRRAFLEGAASAAAILGLGAVSLAAEKDAGPRRARKIQKSLKLSMLPKMSGMEERLKVAADAGFDAVEPATMFDPAEVNAIRDAADKAAIRLDAVLCSKHWSHPLSDPDPKTVEVCMEAMRLSLRNAKEIGADMVLLVPAVVKPAVMYRDAYARSLEKVKELARDAEELGVTIGLENVWNKFLLSPLEFKQYVEEVGSPKVKVWFDVGNVLLFGYPQDWILTLGNLIARVDVKDYDVQKKEFVPLREGSVDWPAVMRAFDQIGYEGYFAAEVKGGDLAYLSEKVSKPMDLIIAGQ